MVVLVADLAVVLVVVRVVDQVVAVVHPLPQVVVPAEAQLVVEAYHSCSRRSTPDGKVIRRVLKSPMYPVIN